MKFHVLDNFGGQTKIMLEREFTCEVKAISTCVVEGKESFTCEVKAISTCVVEVKPYLLGKESFTCEVKAISTCVVEVKPYLLGKESFTCEVKAISTCVVEVRPYLRGKESFTCEVNAIFLWLHTNIYIKINSTPIYCTFFFFREVRHVYIMILLESSNKI